MINATPREMALLQLLRSMRFGSIEVTVHEGEPSVVKNAIQRLDLTKDEERERVLQGISSVLIFGPARVERVEAKPKSQKRG